MAVPTNKVYSDLVRITTPFLGPSSERFIDRQIRNHLNKEPEEVHKKDLVNLIDWIRLSISLMTDDSRAIQEYIRNLRRLSGA